MRHRVLLLVVALAALATLNRPAAAIPMEWVRIGNPGNPPDTASNCWSADCGSVPYQYWIGKYEVTNAQYAEFLNAKAKSDPLGLYNGAMGSDATSGGISRSGPAGSYTYAPKAGFENKPVVYVSYYDALRFANWRNNGKGRGDTETGAYTLLGGTAIPGNGQTVTRNPGAITFVAAENEWYKAAYYSPAGVYFDYPAGTDVLPACVPPSADTGNAANCDFAVGAPTAGGAYALSSSAYGTFDQGGNVDEWYEHEPLPIGTSGSRPFRGGEWSSSTVFALAASAKYRSAPSDFDLLPFVGFRLATLVPEPGTALLVATGLLGVAASCNRRAASR